MHILCVILCITFIYKSSYNAVIRYDGEKIAERSGQERKSEATEEAGELMRKRSEDTATHQTRLSSEEE